MRLIKFLRKPLFLEYKYLAFNTSTNPYISIGDVGVKIQVAADIVGSPRSVIDIVQFQYNRCVPAVATNDNSDTSPSKVSSLQATGFREPRLPVQTAIKVSYDSFQLYPEIAIGFLAEYIYTRRMQSQMGIFPFTGKLIGVIYIRVPYRMGSLPSCCRYHDIRCAVITFAESKSSWPGGAA